jgi:threonine dehydrogenase-like Zn-dependent dehydrogenase
MMASFRRWNLVTSWVTSSWASSKRWEKTLPIYVEGIEWWCHLPSPAATVSFARKKIWSACDNSNPNAHLTEAVYGYSGSGLFSYSHMMGGYAGGQAQYARVPFANVGPLKIESDLPDEKVLFLCDIFPTGYMAAENAQIQPGDTVAVWGCGPVSQFAIASAFMLGAARVIAIDRLPQRLALARSLGVITVDYEEDVGVLTALKDLTGGIGPDACIDAVGLEAHSAQLQGTYDKVKVALLMETDRPSVLRQAIQAVRKGGTLSVPGVYGGLLHYQYNVHSGI